MTITWADIQRIVGEWVSHPVKRPFNKRLTNGNVITPASFMPEESYFSVKLVEMSLAEGGRYFVDFLPLGVCLTEFTVGETRQRTPLVVSNETIAAGLEAAGAKPGYVEFKNMYAVRCAPVRSDNLSLFVGLFRMPYNDMAKQLLQFASDITEEVNLGVPGLSTGVAATSKVYDRVAGLFKLNAVSPRFGFADGNALTESGFLLVAGPSDEDLTQKQLEVTDNRLLVDGKAPSGFDYCLVALEHTPTLLPQGDATINPLTNLAFHRHWKKVAQLLASRKLDEADEQLAVLRAEIVVSPELTETDRYVAVAAYETSFEKLRERWKPKTLDAAAPTRAGRSGTPSAALLAAADASKANRSATSTALRQISLRLRTGGEAGEVGDIAFSEALLAGEAVALRQSLTGGPEARRVSAANLAEAIVGALTPAAR